MKRFLCILLTLCVLMTATLPTYAISANSLSAELSSAQITPMFTYIALLGVGLNINSNGLAACGGTAIIYNTLYTCSMTMKLQRYTSSWTTIQTWTFSGDDTLDVTEYYYVTSGYDYRVVITVKVYNQNGTLLETQTATSATRSY
ncbi:MAG: hypothetical protein VB086_02925 [Clostridiaceae bacterium]|nr:hypothetical protein [Clostridiaceae bacterium]